MACSYCGKTPACFELWLKVFSLLTSWKNKVLSSLGPRHTCV